MSWCPRPLAGMHSVMTAGPTVSDAARNEAKELLRAVSRASYEVGAIKQGCWSSPVHSGPIRLQHAESLQWLVRSANRTTHHASLCSMSACDSACVSRQPIRP